MNKIKELFSNISDKELQLAIREIKESDSTGFVKEGGLVRKYSNLSGEITNGHLSTDFFFTTVNLLKEAAYRWAK